MARTWGYSGQKKYTKKPDSWKGQKQTRTADGQQEMNPNEILNKKNPSGERSFGRDKHGGLSWTGQKTDFREVITSQGNIMAYHEDGSCAQWDPGSRNTYCSGGVSTNPDNSDSVQGGMVRNNDCNLDNDKIAEASGGKRGGGKFDTCGGHHMQYTSGDVVQASSGRSAVKGYHSGDGKGAIGGWSIEGNGDTTKGYRSVVSHGAKAMTQFSQRGDGTTVLAVSNVKSDKGDYTLTIDPQGNMTIETKGSITVKSEGDHTIEAPNLKIKAKVHVDPTLEATEYLKAPFCHSCADKAKGSC